MILNLIKVLQTTRAHPRVGVLIATVIKGVDDIIHFGILFLIVFVTFAWTGNWAFGNVSDEFVTLQAAMTTQFGMLNGEFPEGFDDDNRMIAYVVLTFVVQVLEMYRGMHLRCARVRLGCVLSSELTGKLMVMACGLFPSPVSALKSFCEFPDDPPFLALSCSAKDFQQAHLKYPLLTTSIHSLCPSFFDPTCAHSAVLCSTSCSPL